MAGRAIQRTGTNKRKSSLYSRFLEVTKAFQDDLLPLLALHPGPDKQPPSGKQWPEIMEATKLSWWEKWSLSRKTSAGKPMPPRWAEPTWEVIVLFGPFPGAKHFLDFCFGGLHVGMGNDAPATGRHDAREREAQRKKQKGQTERVEASKGADDDKENVVQQVLTAMKSAPSATAAALMQNNEIWSAQLVMKYGEVEQKRKAPALLMSAMGAEAHPQGVATGTALGSKEADDSNDVDSSVM